MTGLRHEVTRLAKKHRRLKKHELLILDEFNQNTGDESARIIDTIAANSNTAAEAENSLFLQEALSLLTPEQKKVILATVLEGVTEQKAAKELGMSQQAVNRIKKRALNRLRKHFIMDKYAIMGGIKGTVLLIPLNSTLTSFASLSRHGCNPLNSKPTNKLYPIN